MSLSPGSLSVAGIDFLDPMLESARTEVASPLRLRFVAVTTVD